MPGFIGQIGNSSLRFSEEKRQLLLLNTLIEDSIYHFEQRTVNKFLNDKIFFANDKYLIITEGVILNNHQMMQQYNAASWQECVETMYEQLGETFYLPWRGSFCGLLYDKKEQKWIVFTNHIGDKQLFYVHVDGTILLSTEMDMLVQTLKQNNVPLSLHRDAVYFTITHGFMIEDQTIANEIKKLPAGHYLRIQDGKTELLQYHRFTNKPNTTITHEDAIKEIDRLFRNAVRLQFEKDKEYGYKHLTCLSGGLDSRMTVWVAHQLGYTEQLNTTFSESGYLDFSIAQQIATELNHDFIFKALDGGECIKDLEHITPITYGQTCYFGLAHGNRLFESLNFAPYGIMHTGMVGDAILGTFFKKMAYNQEVKVGQGAYSQELIERLSDYSFQQTYENEEIFCLYTRGFSGANAGMTSFQRFTDTCSPFCDVDFIEFCYSLPVEWRFNHKIYFDWILDCYPQAAAYVWEKLKRRISRIENHKERTMHVLGYEVPHWLEPGFKHYMKGFILRRLGLRKKGVKAKAPQMLTKWNMNPVDYWFSVNPSLSIFVEKYYENNLQYVENQELNHDLSELFNKTTIYDKIQAISVLSAIKKLTIS
jgi:asparagine synthase (glutamine-hydrolysing)